MSFSSATAGIPYPSAAEVIDYWQRRGFAWGQNRVSRIPTGMITRLNPVSVFLSTLFYSPPLGDGELPDPNVVLSPGQWDWVNATSRTTGLRSQDLAFQLALNQKHQVGSNPGVPLPDAVYDQTVDQTYEFKGQPTPGDVAQAELETQRALEQAKRADEDDKPDPDPSPLPVPLPGPRVSRPRCKILPICFMPRSPDIKMDEFTRQMKLQEAALNRMTPGAMLANHTAYRANPEGMRALSEPLQEQTRREYQNYITPDFQRRFPATWETKLETHMKGVAALHNPDMIAGGNYASVADPTLNIRDRIGGFNENSSMGRQWQDRETRLVQHAREQAANGCPSVQVSMNVCPSVPGSIGVPK